MQKYISCLLTLMLTLCLQVAVQAQNSMGQQQFFQLKIYHFDNMEQQEVVDDYLESAFLPALHRAGIEPVGVFKPLDEGGEPDLRTFVLIPFDSFDEMQSLHGVLQNDRQYRAEGAGYLDAAGDTEPYSHFENILMEAFALAPAIMEPNLEAPRSERVYELRSYGSPTETLNLNKVEMFNEGGEMAIFTKLDFNAIFYGNVIAGSEMPNLMYMTSFENMESRDEHWDAFFSSPDWDVLSSMEKYDGNVSRSVVQFLQPTSYSDL